jgi:hypothetical protein
MPCEHYKDALVEAAATGAQPEAELRAHLESCAACHSAFAEEHALFFSIDAGLHVAANSSVPTSLLPRVRAVIAEEGTSKRDWTPSRLALAGAAAMMIVFLAARALRQTSVEQSPVRTATNANSPPPRVPPPQAGDLSAAPPLRGSSITPSRAAGSRNPASWPSRASGNAMPEVLVPRDQEGLLVSYAEEWNLRKRAPLAPANSDATNLPPLQIAPIQIAQLDVKLLTEEQAQ